MSTNSILDDCGKRPPLALIAGPTASGKSDCAVALAQELECRGRRAVIVNADSSQVYADLRVLSARPSAEEMGGIDHRLFGAWDGAQACSAADWARAAREEIAAVHAAGSVPILVGGTGLYIRTLLDGIAPVPAIDPAVREVVRALPVTEAYAALAVEDPDRAARLSSADSARIARALEVVRSTGQPLARWQAQTQGGIGAAVTLFPAILLPERQALYARCDLRFSTMMARGALDEVRALLARDLDPALPVMRAIGVPELARHIAGDSSLEAAAAAAAQSTRQYAKRQFTWLRHQPPADWPCLEYDNFDTHSLRVILFRSFGLT
ncbi:tRNA (adenosine(37)-N6)-dimethylallyltransferase MiaA [Novosphingobium colocasiae]|uniref:tRNA dimethylallyltransferase n=1 Tax=Novosphingobium colocasiae TaxID=1256513 RepID=A0A918PHP7_9SPHN|nr:tRNA (adenosine(37)-N6)-dimethylallyltransferase MiaA [Novosphingobium colocasiae]GGZ10460.1 tRNA dimethylallyltransferase [Novosphingobium colocasiae]